jgi:hypothetical protein
VRFCCSRPLQHSAELIFTYLYGDNEIDFSQRHEIVQPLANITLVNGTNASVVSVMGIDAGSVVVGVNGTSTEFEE